MIPAIASVRHYSPTNRFQVSGGNILDPSGNIFTPKGINLPDPGNSLGTNTLTLFPGINFVRLAALSLYSVATLTPLVTTLTNAPVVIEIENHTFGIPPLTGADLTAETNWLAELATTWINNPYVWFGSQNEPSSANGMTAEHVAVYNAVRGTGNNNPVIFMSGVGGGDPGGVGPASLTPASYASMTNIIWDFHFYGAQVPGQSTNQNTVNSALYGNTTDTGVLAASQITSADGQVPVICGEYGPAANGVDLDANSERAIYAVQNWALPNGYIKGFVGWYYGTDPSDPNSMTLDEVTLTSWGHTMANAIASSAPTITVISASDFQPSGQLAVRSAMLTAALAYNPDYLIAAGDLCNSSNSSGPFDYSTSDVTLSWLNAKTNWMYLCPGDHDEYSSAGVNSPNFLNAFGARFPAGTTVTTCYFSVNLGAWHFIFLDSWQPITVGSTQYNWLQADLAANPNKPICCLWHWARWSIDSGHGNNATMQPAWELLYAAKADVIISGHCHLYQRWQPIGSGGVLAADGVVEFVNGKCGQDCYGSTGSDAKIANYMTTTVGGQQSAGFTVFRFGPRSYSWRFVGGSNGTTFSATEFDYGTANVHNPV